MLSFPPFRLDLDSERLWRSGEEVKLRRKPFAILRHLVQNPQRLVTHAEIVEAVWGKIAMSESLLRTHVSDLREALGEGMVETVVGRGYRFVAEISDIYVEAPRAGLQAAMEAKFAAKPIVGRESELEIFRVALRSALERKRTTVLVTGEAGVGKTTLVELFLEKAGAENALLVGRGACVEQYGSGQAYLPILDAIAGVCRGRGGDRVIDVFARHAPTWLVQLPGLLVPDRLEELERRAKGAHQARTLRELAEALEALSNIAPVVIVLEDLHWTDPSTAELLAILGSRRDQARLLVVGTCRPAELTRGHPLTRVAGELVAHKQASLMALEGFSTETLEAYLARRFQDHRFPPALTRTLAETTGGNPLFVATLLDDLEGQGLIELRDGGWQLSTSVEDVAARRPDGIRRLIDAQIDRLGALEQRIIETAAVVGTTFRSGAVAHALDIDADSVDSTCESLATDRGLFQYVGTETWPDGTIQSIYAFAHSLFQHAALSRTTSANARARHRKISERLELGYASREGEVAAELALHFDRGQMPGKAALHYVAAGDRAALRYGLREAIAHYERALTLLGASPATREREVLEMNAVRSLGWKLFQVDGTTDAAFPLVENAKDLAKHLDDEAGLAGAFGSLDDVFGVLRLRELLQTFYLARSDLRNASEQGRAAGPLLAHATDPAVRARARQFDIATHLLRGNFEETLRRLEEMGILKAQEGTVITAPERTPFVAMSHGAFALWLTGKPDDAVALARRGYEAAEALNDLWERAALLSDWATVHAWRREPTKVEELAKRSLALAEEGGFGFWNNRADLLCRWAEVELTENMTEARTEELLDKPWVVSYSRTLPTLVFAEMCMKLGRAGQALRMVSEALELLERSDERWLEAELHRVRGELVRPDNAAEAERSFVKAIEIARKQSALSLELRATLSLHSLVAAAKKKRARDDLARLLSLIKGGDDTPDVADARRVLGR